MHVDTFAQDHLPPRDQWPQLPIPPGLEYAEELNAAAELLGGPWPDRPCVHAEETWTYAELRDRAERIARVGLAGADMGVCALLPRIIGQGRTAELLFTGRSMSAEEGERWGFFNRLVEPEALGEEARALAGELAAGPNFAHAMTKRMLDQEWDMGVDAAIEAEAQAQAICMQTRDFERAYRAFAEKRRPEFEGD